ncbi:hypothetical protein SMICM17S_00196 [Streptomyces microflavus]
MAGIEIDPERVAAAKPYEREGLTFVHGGFEIPLEVRPTLIRAANVLRQYDEGQVAEVWARLCSRLAPGGLLVEGTCDEIGRRHVWVALGPEGPRTVTFATRLGSLERPSDLAERLPKALIHRNVPGEPGPRVPARLRPGLGGGLPLCVARRPAALDRRGAGAVGRLAGDGRRTAVAPGRGHGGVGRPAARRPLNDHPTGRKYALPGNDGNADRVSFVLGMGITRRRTPTASVALRDDMARSRRRLNVTDGKSDARYPASIAFVLISFLLGELVNRRHCAAAAITLVCALSLLTVPVQAMAAPTPDSTPSPSASAPSSPGPSSEKDLEKVREQIETLYRQAAAATDAYNLAEEQTKKQSGEIVKLAKAIVDGQARIAELKDRAGAQAREQYRNGGLPPGAQLVLSDDPQLFLDGVNKVRTSQQASKGPGRAEPDPGGPGDVHPGREQQLAQAGDEPGQAGQGQEEDQRPDSLGGEARIGAGDGGARRLRQLEQEAANRAQSAWLATRPVQDVEAISGEASAAGKAAIAFATAQIGKPYVWGATGPGSHDCSGLTMKAWAAAGRPIPRTSQEQWRLLPRIDIKDMRPGDLIIYHADASHVAMYVGDGTIVHSPRPGRHVTLAGAGSMKILGVGRPDK